MTKPLLLNIFLLIGLVLASVSVSATLNDSLVFYASFDVNETPEISDVTTKSIDALHNTTECELGGCYFSDGSLEIRYDDNAIWTFGTGNVSYNWWYYPNVNPVSRTAMIGTDFPSPLSNENVYAVFQDNNEIEHTKNSANEEIVDTTNIQAWAMMSSVRTNGVWQLYKNGVAIGTGLSHTESLNWTGFSVMFAAANSQFEGNIDEVGVWSRALNASDINTLLTCYGNNTNPINCSLNNDPTIALNNPADNARNLSFTVSYTPTDVDGDLLTCTVFVNDTINVTNSNLTSGVEITKTLSASDSTYSWLVGCNDGLVSINSSSRSFRLDSNPPLSIGASPTTGNFNWHETPTLEFTGTYEDVDGMFNVSFTLFNESGVVFSAHNDTLLNISQLSLNAQVDLSTLANGAYTAHWNGTDPHTRERIPSFAPAIDAVEKRITYFPPEYPDQEISIALTQSLYPVVSFGDTKKIDRHSWDYLIAIPVPEQNLDHLYTFELRSKTPLLLFDAEKGHFIIWNSLNWITFDVDNTDTETYVYRDLGFVNGRYVWEIDVITDQTHLIFNSIGGLNVGSETYQYNITGQAVCNVNTGTCYNTLQSAADNASANDQLNIIEDFILQESIIFTTGGLTITHNATSGQPTIVGVTTSEPVFDLATSASGTYVIDSLHIVHGDGMGIAVDGTVTQVTITNNIFDINASTGNNWGDGGANGIWIAQGDNHIIENNTITLNGGVCCNYGVHVDASWNDIALENVLISNNLLSIFGQGGFDGGIAIYEDTLRATDVTMSDNIITVFTTGLSDSGFGLYVSGALTLILQDNIFDITGQKGGAGLWLDGTSTGANVTVFRDSYTVNSINSSFPSHPIVSVATEQLRLTNATFINAEGLADILTGASTSFCRTEPVINVTNPTWNGNITFKDNTAWFITTTIQCGEAHVSYDVIIVTNVSGSNIILNSTNKDIRNPTNTLVGVADANGNFSVSLGAFYANNATYFVTPYLDFTPYEINVSASGFQNNETSVSISTANEIILLSMAEAVVPPITGYVAAYTSDDIAPISIDLIASIFVLLVIFASIIALYFFAKFTGWRPFNFKGGEK